MTTKNGVIIIALAIAGFWIAGHVQAFNPQPDPPGKTGLVGIIASQTARLDAVAIHEVEKACMVEMSILDIDGNVLASARHELRRGKGVFLDLLGTAALTGRAGPRAEIRGLVKLLLGGPDTKGCLIAPTFQLYDSGTGKSDLSIYGVHDVEEGPVK